MAKPMRPIWVEPETGKIQIIDQRQLPHRFEVLTLESVDDTISAIRDMAVRGAPLIGVTAAYGVVLAACAARHDSEPDSYLVHASDRLKAARPTAVNLAWAVDTILAEILAIENPENRITAARRQADRITEQEVENCRCIGETGVSLIETISREKAGQTVNVLTHCNAGWLACIEYGTATAPIYVAHRRGIDIHVWVDETRPLNQGSRLTAWELGQAGVAHTVITDNAGGHLMQHQMVDMVIVGTDRTTYTGDVANKIGTYLKALAARDNDIPFYVALPSSSFDWKVSDGVTGIPIEQRHPDEVRLVQGLDETTVRTVLVPPAKSPAANFAFDVTPARLVTGFITERGICAATPEAIARLFPQRGPG
jgi:methylthioribose-1-phosphate isomerase